MLENEKKKHNTEDLINPLKSIGLSFARFGPVGWAAVRSVDQSFGRPTGRSDRGRQIGEPISNIVSPDVY